MDDCIEWAGRRDPQGYGRTGADRRAHRIAYQKAFGRIPKGMLVRHRCDNPPCVNPNHLELGTQVDNMRDAVARGRIARGPRLPQTKFTADDYRRFANMYATGMTFRQVAEETGASPMTVWWAVRKGPRPT